MHFEFNTRDPASTFTGRESFLQKIDSIVTTKDFCNLIISGLGGIGKTELISSYIKIYKNNFDAIVWINAESLNAFKSSFYALAAKLKIESTKESPLHVVAKNVPERLSTFGTKIVYIFDNADEISPREELPVEFENCFFLITSRHNNWDRYRNTKIIPLEALTTEEAVKFVCKAMDGFQINKDGDDIKSFVTKMECLPLALKQAVSYVKREKHLLKTYTFDNYCSEYESNFDITKKLLEHTPQEVSHMGDISSTDNIVSIFNTWQLTFDKIRKMSYPSKDITERETNEDFDSLPSQILNISTYLLSNNIPNRLFLHLAKSKDHWQWAINILQMYSLATVNEDEMKIHTLIQKVTHIKLLEQKKTSDFG